MVAGNRSFDSGMPTRRLLFPIGPSVWERDTTGQRAPGNGTNADIGRGKSIPHTCAMRWRVGREARNV